MIIDILPISNLRFELVQYYTIRVEGRGKSEFNDFTERMRREDRNSKELAEINRYIEQIGKFYGAYGQHFRHEGAAEGLPPPYHEFLESENEQDFGLRLYCIRLSPSIVILLNGDRKTTLKAQNCDNCRKHFSLAQQVAKVINQAIADGYIEINEAEKEIDIEEDFDLSI